MPVSAQSKNPGIEGDRVEYRQNVLREFIFIVSYRSRTVFWIFSIFFFATTVVTVSLPPVYKSTSTFSLFIPKNLDPLRQETFYVEKRIKRYLQDQKELIMSNRVLQKVCKEIYPDSIKDMQKTIDNIRKNLEVVPPKGETFEGTNAFYLSFQDTDPFRAAGLARTISKAYLETYGEMSKARSDYSFNFFKQQTQKLYDEMLEREKELRDYETQQALALIEILNLGSGTGANLEVGPQALLTQFTRKYHELQEELAGILFTIEAVEKEMQDNKIPAILPEMEVYGRAISVFKSKVAQLQIELNELTPRFKKEFELSQQVAEALDMNIESLRNELERTVRAQKITAQGIEAKIHEIAKVIQGLKENIRSTAQERSIYEHLKQEYIIAKDAYVNSRDQQQQARLAQSLNQEKQYITLVDEPVVPSKPFKPNRMILIALGFFAGVFLGIATALTLDHFDHSIKKVEDIERFLEVPFLGSISTRVRGSTS